MSAWVVDLYENGTERVFRCTTVAVTEEWAVRYVLDDVEKIEPELRNNCTVRVAPIVDGDVVRPMTRIPS